MIWKGTPLPRGCHVCASGGRARASPARGSFARVSLKTASAPASIHAAFRFRDFSPSPSPPPLRASSSSARSPTRCNWGEGVRGGPCTLVSTFLMLSDLLFTCGSAAALYGRLFCLLMPATVYIRAVHCASRNRVTGIYRC